LPETPAGHLTDVLLPALSFHSCAELGQVVGKDKRRAGTVRARDYRNVLIGQLYARVERSNCRRVPLAYFAEINIREHGAAQPQCARFDALDIDDRHYAAHHHWKLHETVFLELGGLERRVGCAKIHGLGENLLDAAAGAYRLIVKPHAGFRAISFRPLGINRIRERRAGAGDVGGPRQAPPKPSPMLSRRLPASVEQMRISLQALQIRCAGRTCGMGAIISTDCYSFVTRPGARWSRAPSPQARRMRTGRCQDLWV
jgi:hypothetical protein